MKCINCFLYFDNVWCVILIRKESFECYWFYVGIYYVYMVGDVFIIFWGIKRKLMRDLLYNYLNIDNYNNIIISILMVLFLLRCFVLLK